MKYINLGRVPKTYFSVTLKPGEVVDVPGKITNKFIVPVKTDNSLSVSEKSTSDDNKKPAVKKTNKSNIEKESEEKDG